MILRGCRARRALALVACTLASASACESEPPRVVVRVSPQTFEASSRLRVIVRECGKEELALVEDVSPSASSGTVEQLEAALLPAKTFYVWLQLWHPCEATTCKNDALPGECACLPEETPTAQRIEEEACSPWITAPTDVTLSLHPIGGCPPDPIPCNDETL